MSTNSPIHIFAHIRAETGKADDLRAVLIRLVTATKGEPGNLHYILHEDIDTAGSFHVFEAYQDETAVNAHMQSAHLKAASEQMRTLIDSRPTVIKARPLAGS
jgi:quinol monooxygenase YgiN